MVALVLLPGMDGTGTMFADFAAALPPTIKSIVIAYPEKQAWDYRELEAHVRTCLPKNEPYVLMGESFSGPLAIALAASRPVGLTGLILCCTFARNPRPVLGLLQPLVGMLPISSRLSGLIAPLLFGRHATAGLRHTLHQALRRIPASTLRCRLRAVAEVDVSSKLCAIQMPVLYLQATEDRIVPPSALQHLQQCSLTIRTKRVQGPHLLLQAAPREAATIVGDFIEALAQTNFTP